jgi:hypothetical protein
MDAPLARLQDRLDALERSRRRERVLLAVSVLALVALAAGLPQEPADEPLDRVVAREVVIVDAEGTTRLRLGGAPDPQRREPACGLLVYDSAGTERGGFATFADGSVVLALDAPAGVGAAMRDRAALLVDADGAAEVRLLDNRTMIPVRLVSDAAGGGGLEFLDYDLEKGECTVTRQTSAGSSTTVHALGG